MLKDGYKEERAIPIATKQAESWYKDATKEELEELQNKKIFLFCNSSNSSFVASLYQDSACFVAMGIARSSLYPSFNIALPISRQTEIIEHKKDE